MIGNFPTNTLRKDVIPVKLERISENEIHCILESDDLQERNIQLSELAYGSEKAKHLFQEMLQKAGYELDFDTQNIPLMIETIPLQNNRVILIITRVEDMDELDTRFVQLAPNQLEQLEFDETEDDFMEDDDEEEDLFPNRFASTSKTTNVSNEISKLFAFATFEEAQSAAHAIVPIYQGHSRLYHDTRSQRYFLALQSEDSTHFEQITAILSEFSSITTKIPSEAFCQEHFRTILSENAIALLDSLLN